MESWRRGGDGDWPSWQTQEVTDIVDVKMSMAGELVKDEEPFLWTKHGCVPTIKLIVWSIWCVVHTHTHTYSLCGASGVWDTHTHTDSTHLPP